MLILAPVYRLTIRFRHVHFKMLTSAFSILWLLIQFYFLSNDQLCSDAGPSWSETSINLIYFQITSPLTPWQDKISSAHWLETLRMTSKIPCQTNNIVRWVWQKWIFYVRTNLNNTTISKWASCTLIYWPFWTSPHTDRIFFNFIKSAHFPKKTCKLRHFEL